MIVVFARNLLNKSKAMDFTSIGEVQSQVQWAWRSLNHYYAPNTFRLIASELGGMYKYARVVEPHREGISPEKLLNERSLCVKERDNDRVQLK